MKEGSEEGSEGAREREEAREGGREGGGRERERESVCERGETKLGHARSVCARTRIENETD
jgi:hypothetical protein